MKRFDSTGKFSYFSARTVVSAGLGSFFTVAAVVSMRGGFFTRGASAEFVRPSVAFNALDDGIIEVPGEASSLQAAVDFATSGATIRLESGTYAGRVVLNGKSINIQGAGMDATMIRGFGDGPVLSFVGDGSQRVEIAGLSIVAGHGASGCGFYAEGVEYGLRDVRFAGNQGSGAVLKGGSGSFNTCTFDGNRGPVSGGAVASENSSPTFVACEFRSNVAATFGGAIYSQGGRVSLLACTIEDNATRSGAWGGAVFGDDTTFEVHGTDFSRNRSLESGGAIYLLGGIADVSRCSFSGNMSEAACSLFSRGAGVRIATTHMCGAESATLGGDFAFGDGNVFDTACFGDCNQNGTSDAEEIALGWSPDRDGNGVPDACDPDCNSNGLPDGYEIGAGFAQDMNANGLIDICEIRSGLALDVDHDWIPDDAQLPVVDALSMPAAPAAPVAPAASAPVPVPDPYESWGPGMMHSLGGPYDRR